MAVRRTEVRYGDQPPATVEIEHRRRRAGREVGHDLDRPTRGGERQPRSQRIQDPREHLRLGVLRPLDPGRGHVTAEVVPVAHEVAGLTPVAARRRVAEVPARRLQVRRDQRRATGQQSPQGPVPAVRLGDQQRQPAIREQLGIPPYLCLEVRGIVVRVEIARGYDVLHVAGGTEKITLTGAGDQRHGDAMGNRLVAQRGDVAGAVLAVEEVELVLQLDHDDRATGSVLAGGEDRQHLVEPLRHPAEEAGLVLAHLQRRIQTEPGRQRAAVPLRADVRTGPGDDLQTHFVREIQERGHVAPPVERPAAGRELVEVPRQVHVHTGVARRLDLVEPFPPLLPGQPEVEQGRAQHDLRLTVDPDTTRIHRHCVHLTPALPPLMSISYRYRCPR